MAPYRGPHLEAPPPSENLADTVEQDQVATQATSDPTNITPIESIPGGRTTSSSSLSTPSASLVPLARVRKIDAQMATLLHHI